MPAPVDTRPSWLTWVLYGSTPEQRALRLRARGEIRTLVEAATRLKETKTRAAERLEAAVAAYRERFVEETLDARPVEDLAEATRSACIESLKHAGYRTIGDLHQVRSDQLLQLYGIGQVSADQVVRAVSALASVVRREPLHLPPPDEVDARHAGILAALYSRLRSRNIRDGAIQELRTSARALKRSMYAAKWASSLWDRLFNQPATVPEVYARHRQLRDALAAQQASTAVAEAKATLADLEPPQRIESLVADYTDRYADYIAILEGVTERAAPPDARRTTRYGGTPERIAAEVEALSLVTEGMAIDLRGYQEFGAKYIVARRRTVLGDEMGLGKTIQALAAIVHLSNVEKHTHFLVVAPASILDNWHREVTSRTDLRVWMVHGIAREVELEHWRRQGGIAITSYATLRTLTWRDRCPIHLLVADEGHYVKNEDAGRSRRIAALAEKCDRLVLMTGTPLENRIGEFINLIRICNPALSGKLHVLIGDRHGALTRPRVFRDMAAPVYLRRNQEDVLKELPECLAVDEWITLTGSEYRSYVSAVGSRNLMTMRQAANGGGAGAAKFRRVGELVESYRAEGRKVVVYSYFLKALERAGEIIGRHYRIDGRIPPRARMGVIDDFFADRTGSVMVAQILAGGVGINLQCASAVILIEPQIKPTTEWQAIKRVHRMGQSRRVVVHRLIARDTVDESMREILAEKAGVFDDYARDSAIKAASAAARDTSSEALTHRLIEMEVERLNRQSSGSPVLSPSRERPESSAARITVPAA